MFPGPFFESAWQACRGTSQTLAACHLQASVRCSWHSSASGVVLCLAVASTSILTTPYERQQKAPTVLHFDTSRALDRAQALHEASRAMLDRRQKGQSH